MQNWLKIRPQEFVGGGFTGDFAEGLEAFAQVESEEFGAVPHVFEHVGDRVHGAAQAVFLVHAREQGVAGGEVGFAQDNAGECRFEGVPCPRQSRRTRGRRHGKLRVARVAVASGGEVGLVAHEHTGSLQHSEFGGKDAIFFDGGHAHVDHQQDALGLGEGFARAGDADSLDRVVGHAQAGGVHETHGRTAEGHEFLETIPRGAGNVGHDGAVVAEERVE